MTKKTVLIQGNLDKLRSLCQKGYSITSIRMRPTLESLNPDELLPQTEVHLGGAKQDVVFSSEDESLFNYCSTLQESLDGDGNLMFRRFVSTSRYFSELKELVDHDEVKYQQAYEHYTSGQVTLPFVPEALVSEFLVSPNWASGKYLPLKQQHPLVKVAIRSVGKSLLDSQKQLLREFPGSESYASQVEHLLKAGFEHPGNLVRTFRSFLKSLEVDLLETGQEFLEQFTQTAKPLSMWKQPGEMPSGVVALQLVDIYRRYAELVSPLIKVLSDAVYLVEQRGLPVEQRCLLEPTLGFTKRCEIIKVSQFGQILDSLDPRIRNAASHNGVKYFDEMETVQFTEVDAKRKPVSHFKMTYDEIVDKTQQLEKFVLGLSSALIMHQMSLLLLVVDTKEYVKLLLMIDNLAE